MERILQFTEDSMDTISSSDSQPSGKTQPPPEGGVESMEEDSGGNGLLSVDGGGGSLYDGGSGPPSLGSLSLSSSQPASLGQQPHSLSVSTGRSERKRERKCFVDIIPLSGVYVQEGGTERIGGEKHNFTLSRIFHSRKCYSHNSHHAHRHPLPNYPSLNSNRS